MEANDVLERTPAQAQGPPPPGIPPWPRPAKTGYPHASVPEQVSKYNIVSYTLSFQEGLLSQTQANC